MTLAPHAPDLARRVFSPIARDYDRPSQVLSLFRYRAWHRALVSKLDLPRDARVLDMATGTGAVAAEIARRGGSEVIGCDITRSKPLTAELVEGSAEALPFRDESFDAVVFAYLLRYVEDVPATLGGLARLLRPGGTMAGLDFAVPQGAWNPLWRFYTGALLPAGGRLFSRDWQRVCAFLGPSIRDFEARWPQERLLDAWRECGFGEVQTCRLTLGGGQIVWGRKSWT
jgi:demethylmenaquinone methyltransferase/2-methoxy-6-polyprenyl-1,4-benzoquinol methylase